MQLYERSIHHILDIAGFVFQIDGCGEKPKKQGQEADQEVRDKAEEAQSRKAARVREETTEDL